MRDDIHKKAPIPAGLQRVLGQALREADRQNPQRLADACVRPLIALLKRSIDPMVVVSLLEADRMPTLFGPVVADAGLKTRLQSDLLELASYSNGERTPELLRRSLSSYVASLANEAEAALIAEGARRSDPDLIAGMQAFRTALNTAGGVSVGLYIKKQTAPIAEKIQLSEPLPLGRLARKTDR